MTPLQIAKGLTEAQRSLWIRTVLTVIDTEPRRRAFVAGYNGEPMEKPSNPGKRDRYALGQQVREILLQSETNNG